jgi:hypothetical protein
MSIHNIIDSPWGYAPLDTDESNMSFKRSMFGKVHKNELTEWNNEFLTCSMKVSAVRVMSQSIPATPPATVATAIANSIIIHTGSYQAAVTPEGGRIYCIMDSADSSGKTWVAVHSGTVATLASQARPFSSTGSDKNFILTDFIAPWHVTGSDTGYNAYQIKVFACTGSGNPPASVTEVSASSKLGWVFYYDAGVLKFTNPTLTFPFTGFVNFEDNVDSLSSYTDDGWSILLQTKTTTEHNIVLGGAWISGSGAGEVQHKLWDMAANARWVATTGSCFAVDTYRYVGAYSI